MKKNVFFLSLFCMLSAQQYVGAQSIGGGMPQKQAAIFDRITTNPASNHSLTGAGDPKDGYINLYLNASYAGRVSKVVYQVANQTDYPELNRPVTVAVTGNKARIPNLTYNSYMLRSLQLSDGRVVLMDTTESIAVYSAGRHGQPRGGSLQDFTRNMEGPNVSPFIRSYKQANQATNTPLMKGAAAPCNEGQWLVIRGGAVIIAENSCQQRETFGCIYHAGASAIAGEYFNSNGGKIEDQSLILTSNRPSQTYKVGKTKAVISPSSTTIKRDPVTGADVPVVLTAGWVSSIGTNSENTDSLRMPVTYSWSNGLGTGKVKSVTVPGVYVLTAEVGGFVYTTSVSIKRNGYAGQSKTLSICENDGIIDLDYLTPGKDNGGVWTRTYGRGGIFNTAAGITTFDVTGATASKFNYTVQGENGGAAHIATLTVLVDPIPNAGSDGQIDVCNPSTVAIALANLITGEQAGGVWTRESGTGGIFDAAGGTFVTRGATSSTFKYTVGGSCVSPASSVATVNMVASPNAGASRALTYYRARPEDINLNSLLTSGAQSHGKWARVAGSGGIFNAANGTFNTSGASSSIFRYTVPAVYGCIAAYADMTIHISSSTPPAANKGLSSRANGSISEGIQELRVYPNPANDHLMLTGIEEKTADITVYATDGRVAASYPNHNLSQGINVSVLPIGTYQLKVTSGASVFISRFVVVR